MMMSRNPAQANNPQARLMKYLPLVFTVVFIRFPAGVLLYYAMSNICRIVQQDLMYRFDPKVKGLVAREIEEVETLTHEIDEKEGNGRRPGGGGRSPGAGGAGTAGGGGGAGSKGASGGRRSRFGDLLAAAAEQQKKKPAGSGDPGAGRHRYREGRTAPDRKLLRLIRLIGSPADVQRNLLQTADERHQRPRARGRQVGIRFE